MITRYVLVCTCNHPKIICPIILGSRFQGMKAKSCNLIKDYLDNPDNYPPEEIQIYKNMVALADSGVAVIADENNVVIYEYTNMYTPKTSLYRIPIDVYKELFDSYCAEVKPCIELPIFNYLTYKTNNSDDDPLYQYRFPSKESEKLVEDNKVRNAVQAMAIGLKVKDKNQ